MANDLGRTLRRQWLRNLAKPRRLRAWRRWSDRLGSLLRPARRRVRAQLRATLVRI